jgi:hypothetical protein
MLGHFGVIISVVGLIARVLSVVSLAHWRRRICRTNDSLDLFLGMQSVVERVR